jgi:hypothetical protein
MVLACALALVLAAGCGGSSSSSASGAESAAKVAPANAAAYIAVDTDLQSGQWKQAQKLLDRFPGKARLLSEIEKQLGAKKLDAKRDVEPALGPETAIVVLTGANDAVGLTKPDDKAKLDELLKRLNEDGGSPYVTREIDGWTAVADTSAVLDAFDRARGQGALENDARFKQAVADLPGEAIAKAYISGDAIQKTADQASTGSADIFTGGGRIVSVGLALEALDNGAKLSGTTRLEGGTRRGAYEAKLLERVPDDALAVLSFNNIAGGLDQAKAAPGVGPALGQLEQFLGVSATELTRLFEGESILYVRAGTPIPEVTLLLDVKDTTAALGTLDRLAAKAAALIGAKTGTTDIGGLQVKYVDVQGVRISYTTFDGLLAVTSGPAGIRDARAGGSKLSGDSRFKAARDAAGMGKTTSGFAYIDLKDAIPLIEGLTGIAGQQLPADASANLAPLQSLFAYAAQDGDVVRFGALLGVTP